MNPPPEGEATSWARNLSHSDPEIRARTVVLMLARPALLGELFHLVVDDPHPKVRAALVFAALFSERHLPPELLRQLLTVELSSHVHSRRYRALGLLHFLQTVDVGLFLSRSAQDCRIEARRSILQTMRSRLPEISEQHIEQILRAQLQSSEWQHRLLGLACLRVEHRIPRGRFLALCAGETQASVHKALVNMIRESASTLSEEQTDALFRPELLALDWKRRLSAVMMLRRMPQKNTAALIHLTAEDPILAVRRAAQKSQAMRP